MGKEKNKTKTFSSVAEAYIAGKRDGMIEGYKRANANIKSTMDQLLEMYIKNANEAFDEAKSKLSERN